MLDWVWFRSDSAADHVVQEQFEPSDVRGVFDTEDDAYRFLEWYAEQCGVVDTSHLELYRADLELEGYGRTFLAELSGHSEEPPKQVDFDT